MIVDELIAILGYEVKGQDKLRSFTQSIENVGRRLATFAAAAGTVAAAAAAALGRSVVQTGMQFEKLHLQLEILEGSAQKAGERMEWLREFAVNTPLDLQQATDAFVRMRNFGLDPLDGSMQAIVDANALMGGSAERLNGIILALGQAWTKQKFQAEEANQLLERGIPAWELMSEATGMTTAKLMELSEKGKIGRKEIKLLIEQMGIRASGASARFAKTMEGQIGKLQDLFMTFKKRIADAGFYDAVKLQLNRLFDYISRLDADGTLQRWAETLSASFTKAANFIAGFAVQVGRHLGTIADIINNNKDAWEWLKWALVAIGVRLFPIASLFLLAAAALDDWLTYMRGGKSVIGDFIEAIADFLGADPQTVADILGNITAAAGGLMGAAIGVSLFAGAIRTLATALGLLGGAGVAKGAGLLSMLGGAVRGAGGLIARHPILAAAGVTYGALNDVPHEAMASATKKDPELLARLARERELTKGIHFEGGRHRAGLGFGPAPGQWIENYGANMAKIGGAAATVVNDSSDRSINVKATATVSVNEVNQAASSAGREVENAVRNAINGSGAARASRFEKDDAF